MNARLEILLVEDSPTDVLLAEEALSTSRFHVQNSQRLGDALKLLLTEPFDVILLDLGLPDSQGLATLRTLRSKSPLVAIVVLTGKDDEELAVQALKEGAQDYLVKGQVQSEVLRRTIRYAIERNLAERALRERATFLEASPDAIISMDHRGTILVFNPAAEKIFGFTQVEAIGQPVADLIIPSPLRSGHSDGLARYLASGHAVILNRRLEFTGLRKDGSEFPVELTITRIHNDGPPVFTAFLRDVTERKRAEAALKLFRALIDHSNDSIEVFDPDTGLFLDMNQTGCETLGYTREEVLRLGVSDVAPPAAAMGWAKVSAELRVRGGKFLETLHRRKDGSVFPVEVNSKLVRMDRDYVVAVVRDISERKKAEEALRQRDEQLQELTAHIDQVLWTVDVRETKILYVSPGYETIFGRSCQSLVDNRQSYLEHIHPLDLERMERENAAMYVTGHIDAECRIVRPDGSERWIWVRGYPVTKQGQIVRVVGVIEDVTEKRRLTAERDALLARLQLHFERMPLAYVLFDADIRIIDWNPTAERIFGYTKAEALGKQGIELVPPSFQAEANKIIARLRAGDMTAHSLNESLTKDGRTIICEWFNTPLMTDDGRCAGLLSLAKDVTEQKSLEAQFHQAQKMEAVGQLAGGVAHDFNNLLTIISGYSEILLTSLEGNDQMHEAVLAISEAGDRAASLTRQLLAFSRKTVLEPKVLDLNVVVRETEKLLRRLLGEDVRLTTVLARDVSQVKVDSDQLGQVLMNLAVNARDAMPRGGKLTIETLNVELDQDYSRLRPDVRPGPYVLLAMTDVGAGMTAEVKARIFEPFFTTKGVGKGTGLGLAVVMGIVKQSGGHVEVYSEPDVGTTFKIYLPAVAEEVSAPKGRDVGAVGRGTETILLVEDEDGVRALGLLILQAHGYNVMAAGDGTAALRLAEKQPGGIDLLVTDVVMPGMGGPDLAEALGRRAPRMKVLFCSGYTGEAVLRHGLLQENVAFLQKPYTPMTLVRKVRQVLDET